ncbi:hypothetical protein CCYA_CCYA10G2963 [Cyanidiococcus yangmingshanensis]|nr:hypothetical protein CCYA_CCYA10G2963 [Cyanidiococcus yangmingshanensis]
MVARIHEKSSRATAGGIAKPLEPDGRPEWRLCGLVPRFQQQEDHHHAYSTIACLAGETSCGTKPAAGQALSTECFSADSSPAPGSLNLSETRRTLQLLLDATALAKRDSHSTGETPQNGKLNRDEQTELELTLALLRNAGKECLSRYPGEQRRGISKPSSSRADGDTPRDLTKRVDSGGYNNPAPARFANSNSGPQLGIQPAHDCVSQTDSNAPYARGNAKSRQRNVCEPPFLSCNGKSRVEEAGFQDLPIESCRDGIEQPESSICNRPESEDSARISHRLNEQKRRRVITSQVDILMNLVPVAREYAEKFGRRLDRATILECASEHIRALEANIVSLKARIHELENANHGANSSKIVTSPITDSNM